MALLTVLSSGLSAQDLLSDLIVIRKWKADTYVDCKGENLTLSILAKPIKNNQNSLSTKTLFVNDEEQKLFLTAKALILKDLNGKTLLKSSSGRDRFYATDNKAYQKKSKLWLKKKLEYYDENDKLILDTRLQHRRIEINLVNPSDANVQYLAAIAFEEMLQYAHTFYSLGGDLPPIIILPD